MKIEKKHLIVVGVLVVIAIVIFVWGKYVGKKNPNVKKVELQFDMHNEDDNTTTSYNPTPIVDELHEVLTAWAYPFNGVLAKRCASLNSLLELSSSSPSEFMAVVYGYKMKHKTTLTQAINACKIDCSSSSGYISVQTQINQRIIALSKVFKPKN